MKLIQTVLLLVLGGFLFVNDSVNAQNSSNPNSSKNPNNTLTQEQRTRQIQNIAKAWAFEADPKLPNVLILGDSNTIGYVLKLRQLLKDKANVYFPLKDNGTPDNCANTAYGLENIDRFIGTIKWDIIHFNWGLHDCNRARVENGKRIPDQKNGELRHSSELYGENLEKIVERLEKTKTKLIWASSSVVNEGTNGNRVGEEVVFNNVAAKIIEKHNIPTDDIYGLTKNFKPEQFKAPGNIHFSKEGFDIIAQQVADIILKNLEK
ncbi:MAG: SGNH/GDSL hydrolase family protein [Planctomycetaceae bacterium]|jgi:acyl-CoA thioesterase-1|nr:SGNH/GDSL hydrolase family protein [Planctomycetaceae bacterium]